MKIEFLIISKTDQSLIYSSNIESTRFQLKSFLVLFDEKNVTSLQSGKSVLRFKSFNNFLYIQICEEPFSELFLDSVMQLFIEWIEFNQINEKEKIEENQAKINIVINAINEMLYKIPNLLVNSNQYCPINHISNQLELKLEKLIQINDHLVSGFVINNYEIVASKTSKMAGDLHSLDISMIMIYINQFKEQKKIQNNKIINDEKGSENRKVGINDEDDNDERILIINKNRFSNESFGNSKSNSILNEQDFKIEKNKSNKWEKLHGLTKFNLRFQGNDFNYKTYLVFYQKIYDSTFLCLINKLVERDNFEQEFLEYSAFLTMERNNQLEYIVSSKGLINSMLGKIKGINNISKMHSWHLDPDQELTPLIQKKMWEFGFVTHETLKKGLSSIFYKKGEFSYSYKLLFTNKNYKKIKTSKNLTYTNNGNYHEIFNEIGDKMVFPNDTKCFELFLIYTGILPFEIIEKYNNLIIKLLFKYLNI
ncbi:hermansky-pudlak syndrome protein [Anaeramoeba flamelloides]|uniref:Hermansky-pudlak syndrome protein n=1 Tax=Anaeramoeba flamelloides TaxID=1746091 RepID=A0AAV7ZPM0_9EUKA|nr:hermansky-pudlak syndrome protein [Anaeramoeba flamelloides]